MSLSIQRQGHRGTFALITSCVIASLLAMTAATAQADPQNSENSDSLKKEENRAARQEKREEKQSDKNASGNKLERCLATVLIRANENEIRACQIAQERTSSPEVKKFAQEMEQQHQAIVEKLAAYGNTKQVAGKGENKKIHETAFRGKLKDENRKKADKNGAADQNDENRIQQTSAEETVTAVADENDKIKNKDKADSDGSFHHQMMNIHDELAEQCRRSMEHELLSKTGNEFDECFVGMQIAAHMHMADTLTVFERHANGDFKNVLEEGLQTTQNHLQHAKSLIKTLAGETTPTTTSETK